MSSSLSHSTSKELESEHDLLQVPFEMLNFEFRSSQKSVEKDLSILEKAMKEMLQKASKQNLSIQDQTNFLDKVVTKLRGVKRKLEETNIEETQLLNTCKDRIDHLNEYPLIDGAISRRKSTSNIDDNQYRTLSNWRRVRVSRVLVDYLLRFGHYETALALADSEKIKHLVNTQVFIQIRGIIEGLKNNDCGPALKWCSENRSRLRKISSNIEFDLRVQEFIELSKQDKKMEAVIHARKYLTNPIVDKGNSSAATTTNEDDNSCKITPEQTNTVKKIMAALAFGPKTLMAGYKELYDDKRWDELVEEFNKENYKLYGMTEEATLFKLLKAGLSALKTPYSYDENSINVNDPLSHPLFKELAKDLPFAHHHHSKLVCSICGDIMDHLNPPLVFPNGNVYSQKGVAENMAKNNGTFVDPRDGKSFQEEDGKKLFIM
ncbi:predicted protein [Naegleria gruberi]|uniref:Predicted protein n=1 Tax=Naegleria gruberi TaxID=5762 RepID=D2VI60_NAEGR|nr:uncharacterized protein NAEGRDRAFT_49744 [Naegleria gruberi]EFC43535.1 predicted protein [Naegleria gruberi]|eukprot:XP_002676279.1 predicted protein [Naegleria gruberi strain NEG-M]